MLRRCGLNSPSVISIKWSSRLRSDLPSSTVHRGAATCRVGGPLWTGVTTTVGHQVSAAGGIRVLPYSFMASRMSEADMRIPPVILASASYSCRTSRSTTVLTETSTGVNSSSQSWRASATSYRCTLLRAIDNRWLSGAHRTDTPSVRGPSIRAGLAGGLLYGLILCRMPDPVTKHGEERKFADVRIRLRFNVERVSVGERIESKVTIEANNRPA